MDKKTNGLISYLTTLIFLLVLALLYIVPYYLGRFFVINVFKWTYLAQDMGYFGFWIYGMLVSLMAIGLIIVIPIIIYAIYQLSKFVADKMINNGI